jgi:hypothetical protein
MGLRATLASPVLVSSAVSSLVTALVFSVALPPLVDAKIDALRAGQIVSVGDSGAERVRVLPGPGEVAQVSLANSRGEDRIRLRVETTADGQPDAGIAIRTPGDNPVTMMRLGTIAQDPELPGPLLHSANLLLRDDSGHDRIRLLVADDGTPRIELINAAGELIWSAP